MNITITRRAALAGTAILAAPATLRAQGQVRLTLAHGTAAANPRGVTADRMAARLRELSNGRIEMRVAHAAQLGDDVAMLTALRTGTLDMSVNSQGPTSSLVPEIAALGLPFLFADANAAYRVVDGPVGQELGQKLAGVGLVSLGFWDNGIRHITNRRRPINRPEDLRGLRIRTPADPATIDTFQALGAATQQINFSELYVALQQGVVDGQENPLANIHASKLHEVNRFISLTAHKWECSPFLASRMAWGRLNEADRNLIMQAAREATLHNRMLMQQADVQLLAEYRGMSSVEVNLADQAAFRAATAGVLDAWQGRPIGGFVRQLRGAVS
ncbi:TRAP transporter substrate-binding protein [Roseococcus sp. SDR]|uniref:TRAP transporter substrate-binding protein n=1 Tax=Roseococcus sp. SDR TaxID=2835532 RepID=UPI001BCB22F8|nr:TRAP transporter substrate-binding protein [Roseococcus sp. SDR]MBS7791685.1 TRAP transporter substrate-binding protein [Roseococcus sp. SDR]MBV1846999.1 TRAP transporter substrate-binding protein [Roseococcus sp. SDR]